MTFNSVPVVKLKRVQSPKSIYATSTSVIIDDPWTSYEVLQEKMIEDPDLLGFDDSPEWGDDVGAPE